jgi:DNA polymerase-3 subunit alpha
MLGANIEAPCLNRSDVLCRLVDKTIYLGLGMIKELERKLLLSILEERSIGGPFQSVRDMLKRLPCSLEQIRLLVRIGAFRFTGKNKKELMWEAHFLLSGQKKKPNVKTLFDAPVKPFRLPQLDREAREDAYDQIELLGFPLCDYFSIYHTEEEGIMARDLNRFVKQEVTALGYLVTLKQTRTSRGEMMLFGNFLDREGYFIDTVHFPPSAKQFPFRGKGVYVLHGIVTEEFGCFSIEVTRMEKAPMLPDPRYADIKRKSPVQKNEWA